MLTPDRAVKYANWVTDYASKTVVSDDALASRLRSVYLFCDKAETMNRRGYNRFFKEHAGELVDDGISVARTAIADFLNYTGCGFRKREKVQEAAQKDIHRSALSAANEHNVKSFVSFLLDQQDYSDNTIRVYRDTMTQYFALFTDFNNTSARAFVDHLIQQGRSAQTVRLRITGLEKYAKYCRKSISLKRPKVQRSLHTDNVPTESEYSRLLEHIKEKDYRFYLCVRTIGTSGCRISELKQITFEDILTGEKIIYGKGNKFRRILFCKTLIDEVKQFARETSASGFILTGRYGKMGDRGFNYRLQEFCKSTKIDVKKGHAHAFRHFFAKMYLKKNKDVVQLSELLGHESVDTTRIYLQKSNDEQKRDFNRSVTW